MKTLNYIKFIAFFPITGIIGYHRYLLWNNGVFFGRLLLFILILLMSAVNDNPKFMTFGLLTMVVFWIYDIINITKIYEKSVNEIDATVDEIVNLGLKGEYKNMFFKLSKKGKAKAYINRMMETGKAGELMKKFATNESEVKEVMAIISRRDEVAAMAFFSKKVGNGLLSFLK